MNTKKLHKTRLVNWVGDLLSKSMECRDSDCRLVASIWAKEKEKISIEIPERFRDDKTLYLLATGRLSSPESIRRIRQKLQEKNPMLRGKKWRQRQKHAKTIRETINTSGNHEIKYSY